MKKLIAIVLVVTVLAMGAGVGLAGGSGVAVAQPGHGAPSGSHYNLNIIGVPKDKTADMKGTSGHTIFVKLDGNSKIWLCESGVDEGCLDVDDFQVLDRNGTDSDGALFALPNPDPDGDGTTVYSVYARALGKPGGKSWTTTCAWDPVEEEWVCSMITLLLKRDKGRSKFDNVSKYLLYMYVDGTRVALFDNKYEDYFWNYDNKGLKLAQLRFYPESTTVPAPPMPCLTEISPNSAAAGTTWSGTITGQATTTSKCAAVNFSGITENDVDFGPHTRTISASAVGNVITATVQIKSNAETGWRLVYVTQPADGLTLNIDFTVT